MKTRRITARGRRFGNVVAVFLAVAVPATGQITETFSFTDLNVPVPDGNAAGLSDRRTPLSSIVTITDLRVKLRVAGEFNGDLYAYLRHVNADRTNFCVLLNRPGRSDLLSSGYDDSGIDVTFDDAASNGDIHAYRLVVALPLGAPLTGTWRPDGRHVDPEVTLETDPATTTLSSFTNTFAAGEWTLFLGDFEAGGTNMLSRWELEITGIGVPPVTWPALADVVYGTALGLAQLNASSPVPGSFSYDPPSGRVLNAGPAQTLTVTFTPADATSYVPVTTNVSINVLRAGSTISVSSSINPALPGVLVRFTSQATAVSPGAGPPTGAVHFKIDGNYFPNQAGIPLDSNGRASVLASLPAGLHTVAVEYAGDSNVTGATNSLDPQFLVNTPPLAGDDALQRSLTNGAKVLVSTLLANDLDPDGNAITFLAAEPSSAHGGQIVRNGNWVHYTPPAGLTNVDWFQYEIVDIHNAVGIGTIFITNQIDSVPSPNLSITDLGNGSFLLRFDGVPGKTYRIEYTEGLAPPAWLELGSATADPSGALLFTDTPPLSAPQRYYRSVYP